MSKQTEDTMMAIYLELEANPHLQKKFKKQMKIMEGQIEHKWKPVVDQWEYALSRIKQDENKTNKRTKTINKKNSKES